ncbi:MAG: DUF4395 domain-containing protein [Coriobacteriia bacterium]|nr:DUF4395 domain-containing protein [Coriobacteriia bacterium]
MGQFKPVSISKGGFAFCRVVVACMLWLSILIQSSWLVGVVFLIMLLSAIFKVEKAPLIQLYKHSIGKLRASENVIVDQNGIFFSHLVGAVFAALCFILTLTVRPKAAWVVTGLFAVLQTSAAFGFCSALKLYTCMVDGTCCRFGRFAKKVKDNA